MLAMILAQDGETPREKATEQAVEAANKVAEAGPAIDVTKVASDLVKDPGQTVSRWAEVTWELAKTYGPSIVGAIVLLFVAYLVANWARRLVIRATLAAKVDITLGKFFGNMAKWGIIIFALVTAAGTVGVSTTGFAAAIAAASLAIGLALQGNLGNLAAGVLLLIFRPFKIGDSVIVAGHSGVVDGIDLFTTNLDTGDNRRLIVPNGAIFGGSIENQSHHPRRRIDYNVPVNPGIDIEQSRKVLNGVLQSIVGQNIGALQDPANGVTLFDIAPVQVWTLHLWVSTPKMGTVRERLLIELKQTIEKYQLAPAAPVQLVRQIT